MNENINMDLLIHKLLSEKGEHKCTFPGNSKYLEFKSESFFLYGTRDPDGSGSNNLNCNSLVYQSKTKDGINFQIDRYIHGEWESKVLELIKPKKLANVQT